MFILKQYLELLSNFYTLKNKRSKALFIRLLFFFSFLDKSKCLHILFYENSRPIYLKFQSPFKLFALQISPTM